MRDNTITAHVGEKTYVKTDPAFQYDYGLKLIIDGVTLPEEYEVHFGNTSSAANKTSIGDATGVLIPDEYLLNGEDIHAYLYLHTDENDGYSVYHIHIPVTDRAAIDEEEITPVEHRAIEKALEALAEAVDETEANVREYPYINDDKYWMVYDAEQGEFVDTGVKAEGESNFDLEIGTVTTLPPGADATASVTWDGDTAQLNLGLPAGDTSNLVSVHDVRANSNDITIYDGADNLAIDDIRIKLYPIQEGSGTPGPRNIRRISGVYGETLVHIVGADATTYNTSFEDEAGVVYSGTFYPLTGKLVVDRVLVTKRCVDMNNTGIQPGWRDSGIKALMGAGISQVFYNQTLNIGTSFGVDTTGDNDLLYLGYDEYRMVQSEWIATEITVQICVPLAEPLEYTFDSYTPTVQLGENTYFVTAGKIDYLRYPCDTKLYVDEAIDNSGYYTLPDGGIPASDLSSGVISTINGKIDASQKGSVNGVAELDQNGKVPSGQLPSYVDDVLEYDSINYFPQYGESGKIYIANDTNKTYRWSGNRYVEISESLALGETSGSAYRGDRGAAAYAAAVTNVESSPVEGSGNLVTSGGVFAAVSEKYTKPADGIPSTDMASAVQTSLGKADTAYQKPAGGIPAEDIADGVIPDPEDLIDDTAGDGDTDKTWSADKLYDLNTAINGKVDEPETEGTSGQVLTTDGNGGRSWTSKPSVPVTDVQVNGTSVLSQGVANVPVANAGGSSSFGVVKFSSTPESAGVTIDAYGNVVTSNASASTIKAGTNSRAPLVTSNLGTAIYYGLSKLAGEDLKNDTVTVGTYPEKSKSAIHQMLNAPETVSGTTPSITAKAGVRYVCGEVATLTITVPASGCIDVTFTSGSTATVLTVTPTKTGVTAVKWVGDFDPTSLETNATYEINIMDGEWGMAVSWT